MSRLQLSRKESRSNDRGELGHPFSFPSCAMTIARRRLASLFPGPIYDDRSAGSKAWHRNRQQPIWPMRFILNRVLLAFILDCASASKEDPTLAPLMRAMPNRNVRSGSRAAASQVDGTARSALSSGNACVPRQLRLVTRSGHLDRHRMDRLRRRLLTTWVSPC